MISGFHYTPNQERDASEHRRVFRYHRTKQKEDKISLLSPTFRPHSKQPKPFILNDCFLYIVCKKQFKKHMDISIRTQQLNSLFSYDKKTDLTDSHLEIIPFRFTQTIGASEINEFQKELTGTDFCPVTDNHIQENKTFTYTVFAPSGKEKRDKAIILLHGLNERTWEKYLTWAEYLAQNTGKPVILFPIAFHMNRTPSRWCNPRETLSWANIRKSEINDLSNSTFANVALSSRLSNNPLRFYASGRESIYNLWQLVLEIKEGKHPLFKEDASINCSPTPSEPSYRKCFYSQTRKRCSVIRTCSCSAAVRSSARWTGMHETSWIRKLSKAYRNTIAMISWNNVCYRPPSKMILWNRRSKP